MAKRRIVLILVFSCSISFLAAQALSQARSSDSSNAERMRNISDEEREREIQQKRTERRLELERLQKMTEQERKRELAKRRRQRELERKQSLRESRKRLAERRREMEPQRKQRELELEMRRKEYEKEKEEAGGFIFAKYALDANEEQWKLIQKKLENVRQLRDQANSTVGASVAGSSVSGAGAKANVPVFQWKKPWKDKPLSELTDAQRLAKQLVMLLEKKNTSPEAFRRKMAALRKVRSKETEFEKPLAEARRELREALTTRQEAVLVLMNRL